MTQQTPHIYVVCIAAYNNGKLHGTWIDCDHDADSIWAEVHKMLASSPEPSAQEWAIHDFENWQGIKIDEHEAVNRIAELAQLLTEHGKPFGAFCSYYGNDITVETFSSSYLGMYKDEEDFVY